MSRRSSGWKSIKWGGGSGWGSRARFKANYRGWLESQGRGGWGRSLSRMGARLGNAEWGRRARIRTALSGSFKGRDSGGIRSAFGTNEPTRDIGGGWFTSAMVDGPLSGLMPGGGRETEPPDLEEQPQPELPGASENEIVPPGAGPPRDQIIPEENFEALRERCVDEIAVLAVRLIGLQDDAEIAAIIDRLTALIGEKYASLVGEWAGERATSPAPAAVLAFALTVVEAAMYDRRKREPFAWKAYRFLRRLLNGQTQTETAIQIRATSSPTG